MHYRIGLDIGIASVGWAVIENNENGEPIRIVDLGSRIFDTAEVPKTGLTLATARRNARSARRRTRRKAHRIKRTKQLLIKYNILTQTEIENLYTKSNLSNIYILRVEGIDRKLKKEELSRVLINLVKKRGYKSNSKSLETEKFEGKNNNMYLGKTVAAVTDNRKLKNEKGYRTVAEMYLKDDKFKLKYKSGEYICDKKGNAIIKLRNSIDEYNTTVERELLLEEVKLILETQKKYNNINDEFIKEYLSIFSSQRNYDEGPSFPSKYSGELIETMIGNCTFEEGEKRAAKATYTFEKFKMLQDFNNIKLLKINLVNSTRGNLYNKSETIKTLTEEQKIKLLNRFREKSNLKISEIRKILEIPYDYIFNIIDYDFRNIKKENIIQVIDEIEKNSKKKLSEFECFHKMRLALDKYEKSYIYNLTEENLDDIATILTLYKSDEKRSEILKLKGFNDEIINKLLPLSFVKFSHLSLKAMNKLIPHLKGGLTYDKAVNCVYKDFKIKIKTNKKSKLSLNDIEEITNPVVRRGVSQAIKVINAIVEKYGKPDLVNIELAREMSKNFIERKKLQKAMLENMELNKEIINEIKKYDIKSSITGQDIVKYKLWKEQNNICPYSGEYIDLQSLFTKETFVEYIIPYSKSFDDSYNNKVLVKVSKDRRNDEMTPIEYLNQCNKDTYEYIKRIENTYSRNKKKRQNLLKEHFTEEDEVTWKERNLKDTQYITRAILNLIRNNLAFEENSKICDDKRVMAVNGKVTSHIRKRLNIEKIREGDKHHAMDAAIIAITTESMINKITNYEKNNKFNDYESLAIKAEFHKNFPVPYKNFELELKSRLMDFDNDVKEGLEILDIPEYKIHGYPKAIFVSRMPKRRVRGSAHKETIAKKSKNESCIILKRPLTALKLNKDNEIDGYYNKQDDVLLYNALKNKLIEFNNNAKEAFKEPFYKPKSDGTLGPLVKKVKLEINSTSNVSLKKMNGVACNGDTVRLDVFYVENEGYYFIPIYVSDTIKDKLPNKACLTQKNSAYWKEMDDKNFIFSVYPNDLLYVKSSNKIRFRPMNKDSKREDFYTDEIFCYYIKCCISSASISVSSHDRVYWQPSLGIRNLLELKKYQVDVLGNYNEVKLPEKRMEFKFKRK